MPFRTVAELLAGRPLLSVAPGTPLREACRMLSDHDIGALAVLEGGRLVGILSERDVIRRAICGNRRIDETLVAEVMTADPQTAAIGESPADALRRMRAGGFRHLPVMEDGRPVAMLSIRDIPTVNRLMWERYIEYRDGQTAALA